MKSFKKVLCAVITLAMLSSLFVIPATAVETQSDSDYIVLLNENFDSGEYTDDGWKDLVSNAEPPLTNGVMNLEGGQWVNVGKMYSFDNAITSGTLKIQYDIKLEKHFFLNVNSVDITSSNKLYGETMPAVWWNNQNIYTHDNSNAQVDSGTLKKSLGVWPDSSNWYTVYATIRPKSSSFDLKMLPKGATDDKDAIFSVTDEPLEDNTGAKQNQVKSISFRCYYGTTLIDNLLINHYPGPIVNENSITITDSKGDAIENIYTNVPQAIGKISIDFGTNMSNVSKITLTGEDVPTIHATVNADKPNYVDITFDGLLKANTTYTLTIPKKVRAENGLGMQYEFTFTFKTGETKSSLSMTGLKVGDNSITDFSALKNNSGSTAVVLTEVINNSSSDMDLVYILAYYKGQMLLSIKTVPITVSKMKSLSEPIEFTLDVPADATRGKLFLWSTLNDLVPYCDPIPFN